MPERTFTRPLHLARQFAADTPWFSVIDSIDHGTPSLSRFLCSSSRSMSSWLGKFWPGDLSEKGLDQEGVCPTSVNHKHPTTIIHWTSFCLVQGRISTHNVSTIHYIRTLGAEYIHFGYDIVGCEDPLPRLDRQRSTHGGLTKTFNNNNEQAMMDNVPAV